MWGTNKQAIPGPVGFAVNRLLNQVKFERAYMAESEGEAVPVDPQGGNEQVQEEVQQDPVAAKFAKEIARRKRRAKYSPNELFK